MKEGRDDLTEITYDFYSISLASDSDGDNDSVDQPLEINAVTTTEKDIKLDSILPIWKKGQTDQEESENLRQYIRDMRRMQALKVTKNEAVLINASLSKSGKTYLYEELPKEAETSIDGFVAYLQTAYGDDRVELIHKLQAIKQGRNENPYTFLSRLVNMYYESKGLQKKTLDEAGTGNEKDEIMSLYINGLYNSETKKILKCELSKLDLVNLPQKTLNITRALEPQTTFSVNNINDTEYRDNKSDSSEDENDCFHVSKNDRRYVTRKRHETKKRSERRQCFNCGSQNHLIRHCPYDDICHICDNEGHTSRNCPQRQRATQDSDTSRNQSGACRVKN